MFSKFITILIIIFVLAGCNLREDKSLPSGLSPFELIDEAIYINSEGLYPTSHTHLWLKVELEVAHDFDFVDEQYDFTPSSLSYNIQVVDEDGETAFFLDFNPIVAFPSEGFTYLGLKYKGDFHRYYPYPQSNTLNGFAAYIDNNYCHFIFNDPGIYQTVYERQTHSAITLEVNPQSSDDINLSLYQAQFILPRALLPLGVNRITLEKIDSPFLAEYDLKLSNFPVNFNIIQNNPGHERYPLIYLPLNPDTDFSQITVKQILRNHSELIFNYNELTESYDQYTIYGNCVILLVNNQGRFIIENKLK